jgi:alpha-L-fucosidase
MSQSHPDRKWKAAILLIAGLVALSPLIGGAPQPAPTYEPTVESLDKHPLPDWYADAKLGIFVHWGLYSVPGWAPTVHAEHDFFTLDYITHNPYAEWYLNSMRIDGSPTQAYHKEHYGANYDYYNFAAIFDKEIQKWHASDWAKIFSDAGAKYVVLTTKHHDGFTLWPSNTPNPTLPADRQHATRDLVGELTKAVNSSGMRMGLYYSGGYDWTFVPGPIKQKEDYQTVKPQTEAYGKYVDAHFREIITRYKPAVLWNDIDYPKSGHPLQIMAEYYNAIPDGVIDDRFGVKHSDFSSPEYKTLNEISPKKWEECRGLGRSFGYNRAEGEAETIKPDELIHLLVDIVSKNGNLLLDVGPEADGTVPAVQMLRLKALGDWLHINGEAIYGSRPWVRANGDTVEGLPVRFTRKSNATYAILLGEPKSATVTIKSLSLKTGSKIYLLGLAEPIKWSQQGADLRLDFPANLAGHYAFAFRLDGPAS